jgi:hypothetical protein
VSLVKPTVKSGSRVLIQNLFCNFWTLLQVSMNFGSLKQFLEFKIIENDLKTPGTVLSRIRPEAEGLLGVAACCGSEPSWPHCPRARPSSQLGPAGSAARCAERAPALVTAHGVPRAALSPTAHLGAWCNGSDDWSTNTLRGTYQTTRGWRGLTGEVAGWWGGGVDLGRWRTTAMELAW